MSLIHQCCQTRCLRLNSSLAPSPSSHTLPRLFGTLNNSTPFANLPRSLLLLFRGWAEPTLPSQYHSPAAASKGAHTNPTYRPYPRCSKQTNQAWDCNLSLARSARTKKRSFVMWDRLFMQFESVVVGLSITVVYHVNCVPRNIDLPGPRHEPQNACLEE